MQVRVLPVLQCSPYSQTATAPITVRASAPIYYHADLKVTGCREAGVMTESERLTLLLSQRVDLLVKRGNATSQSGAIRFNTHLTQQWVRCGRTETRTETICSKSERQRRELLDSRKRIRWNNQCLALRRSEGKGKREGAKRTNERRPREIGGDRLKSYFGRNALAEGW